MTLLPAPTAFPCCLFVLDVVLYVRSNFYASCPCCMCMLRFFLLHVHAPGSIHATCPAAVPAYPCCMSLRQECAACPCSCLLCISMLTYVHAACPYCMSMSLPHVPLACPCFKSLLYVHASCPCFMSLLHVHAESPCCMSV
jgi:hypothetical protein